VQEFQINRSNYSAELGGASGGVINIVSKTGTNQTHGSLFGFFRHQSLDAANPFALARQPDGSLQRVKPPSQRQQFGGSLGGPIRQDRTFYFLAMEGLVRDESSVVSVLTDDSIFQPTARQKEILETLSPFVNFAIQAALQTTPSTISIFRANSGVFPFTTRGYKFSVRLDHRHGTSEQFLFRYNYDQTDESNANIEALVGASRGYSGNGLDSTSMLGWTHTFNSRLINETSLQWNYRSTRLNSIEKYGPGLNVSGYGFFNRDIFLPSNVIERRYEIRNTVSYFRGGHVLKLGGQVLLRGNHTESHTFLSGRFNFGDIPASALSSLLPSDFIINGLQAFNLGVPQFYQQGFGDPTVASTNPYYGFFVQDSWKVRPNLNLDFGLRYELDRRLKPLPTDQNNFAPRFGFAWDPFNDKKTTIRGGYGIFYSPIYYQIDYVVNALGEINGRRQIAQVLTTALTPGPTASYNIYRTLRDAGVIQIPTPARMITPQDLTQFGIQINQTGPVPPGTVLFEASPDYVNPYTQQASLSLDRSIGQNTVVSLGYTFVRTLKITRARDKNLLPAPVDPRLGIRVWSPPYFANPLLAQLNVYESTARAVYSGMIAELKRRFNRSFSMAANYTFSRATDDVVDYNSDFQANDQTNLNAEHALSSFDQRHKFVAYGVWDLPRSGIQVSPIFRANSGRPFNLLAGFDLNQDNHSTTDRPVFAGRNTGLGPNFWTFDLRLSRGFRWRETAKLDLVAEGFNVLNRLNFAAINNTVGNIPGPFNLRGRRDRSPSEPLGFTSALDRRRIQLGVRLSF